MTERPGPVELFAGQPPLHDRTPPVNLEAPVENDRGFNSYRSNQKLTLVDEATGVPLPIVTKRRLPPVGQSLNAQGDVVADLNHNYHPRERLTHGSAIEIALRNSRVEWVHRDDHNSYHGEFWGHIIGDEAQVVKQVVFSAAGFVPDRGLQYDGRDEAKIIRLNRRTRRDLWESGRIKVLNAVTIRDGLVDVALRKDFKGINESTIDEFLNTVDLKRRFELGSNLLSLAVRDVVTPLTPVYRDIYEKRQLKPDANKDIGRFALKLVSHYKRTRALGALEARLKLA